MRIEKVALTWLYKVYCGNNHLMNRQKSIVIAYRCPRCGETVDWQTFDRLKDGGMH